jgi:four helix bundle protein
MKTIRKPEKIPTVTRQILRSATSIGANLDEAIYGNSKADFGRVT